MSTQAPAVSQADLQPSPDVNSNKLCDTVSNIDILSSTTVTMWELPWDDVVFTHILPLLDIKALVTLSITCQDLRQMIQEYFKQIKVFNIGKYGPKISSEALRSMLEKLESCQQLVLTGCKSSLTDQILTVILPKNRRLRYVDISNCISITNYSLQTLAVSCTKLNVLIMEGCVWASPPAVSNIALHCRQMVKINLAGCWSLDDDTVVTICATCYGLQDFTLSRIYGITDRSLAHLANSCPRLRHLCLVDCWRVTDRGIQKLLEYCKVLRKLQIKGCRSITVNCINRLRDKDIITDCARPPAVLIPPNHPPVQI